jgi:CheY-like chemotaxis protein
LTFFSVEPPSCQGALAGWRQGRREARRSPAAESPWVPLVLLVDDDDDNRVMYRKYLEWDGFRIVEAADGVQALDQAAASAPTVVVTEVALPRLNGWEVVRRLKADTRTKDIPVIVLTAHAFVSDANSARAAGCDGYLTKPCLPEDLALAIRSVIINWNPAGSPGGDRAARRRSKPLAS